MASLIEDDMQNLIVPNRTASVTFQAVDFGSTPGYMTLLMSTGEFDDPLEGTMTIKAQESANGSTGWVDIAGSSVSGLGENTFNELIVYRSQRYVRGVVIGTTGSVVGWVSLVGMDTP